MKKIFSLSFFFFVVVFFFFAIFYHRATSKLLLGGKDHANFPPRGWNSYDSFCWTISEQEFLQSAEIVSNRLHAHGYEYVVVDYLWYRRKVKGAYVDSLGFDVIDEWGRMVPDPERWPSSKGGKGFTEVANKVHSMGLKFGIHVMRGISTQAVNANTPILDTATGRAYKESGQKWYAKDIGLREKACAWMQHGFMSVNTKLGAGRAFLKSLYQQYAEWGVDFAFSWPQSKILMVIKLYVPKLENAGILTSPYYGPAYKGWSDFNFSIFSTIFKHDCVFGDDLDIDEITVVSEVLKELDRPILYSLSPGTSVTPVMAKAVSGLANMYRITGDDWDTWGDVASHFDISRDFSSANMIGAQGLLGKSWPDLDMLPLGWLTDPGSNDGPHRKCNLNLDEQRTQMTLWAMAKSPLMFGGDVRNLDDTTYNLITHPTLLEINSFSTNNMEFPYVADIKVSTISSKVLTEQTSTFLEEFGTSDTHYLGLTSCKDNKTNGWSVEALEQDLEQICWRPNLESKFEESLCFYKRKPLLATDEETTYKQQYQGKLHLQAGDRKEFCLDASSKQKLTSKEFKRGSFSPCRHDANQMWELNTDGALKNSYSGLCATVKSIKANAITTGIRAWIATGRKGEIYVAFFNLNHEKVVMSTKISDVVNALPGKKLKTASCKCYEVWTAKDFGKVQSISVPVEMHGVALFVLYCD